MLPNPPAPDTFTHRYIPAFGKRVHRLGLAASFGIDENGVRAAFAGGLSYLFCPQGAKSALIEPLRQELQRDLPPIGSDIVTSSGRARVLAQEILSQQLLVAMEDNRRILIPATDVLTILKRGSGHREDRPRRDNRGSGAPPAEERGSGSQPAEGNPSALPPDTTEPQP